MSGTNLAIVVPSTWKRASICACGTILTNLLLKNCWVSSNKNKNENKRAREGEKYNMQQVIGGSFQFKVNKQIKKLKICYHIAIARKLVN